jgi:uncharacterized repeat protein (TIGR03806 family)
MCVTYSQESGKASRQSLLAVLLLISICLLVPFRMQAQPYGLDNATAVGPYLNNVFPHSAPNSTAKWDVEVAYTNMVFDQPMYMTPYPRTNWQVLVEKPGIIYMFPNRRDMVTNDMRVFLDIRSRLYTVSDSGMTGIAFHPEFGQPGSTNRGFVYVTYKWRPNPDLGANGDYAYIRLSRFTVPDGQMAADPNSEMILLQQLDLQMWHDAGCLMFGQDGFLYFSIGDEGGANDQYNVTQVINERLMSGIFRIDVNKNASLSHPIRRQPFHHPSTPTGWPESYSTNYYVPNDNPFVNPDGSVLEEYYSLGLRNPYRFSQDPVTGLIWIAETGQDTREELDFLTPGANYQWPYLEGIFAGPKAKPATIIGTEKVPVWDYGHTNGNGCLIGGYVYHGTEHAPGLTGKYICVDNVSGRIWAITSDGITLGSVEQIATMPSGSVYGGTSSTGLDANGEIYFLKFGGVGAGRIFKLKTVTSVIPEPPALLSQVGVFTDLASLNPAPGVYPYTVNTPLWSDGAVKKRWLAVPNDGIHDTAQEKIIFSPTNEWQFPKGTVFVKHFELPVDDANPNITKRLETRFVVMDDSGGAYGVTYKWRADGSDADLLLTGTTTDYQISASGGTTRTQTWQFPSREDCQTCHNANAGYVLGLKTHQLNCPEFYPETGRTDNQLRALGHIGLFDSHYSEAQITNYLKSYSISNTTASLESRVRSYIDANCSQCHRPGGVQAYFDARYVTPLAQQGLIYGPTYTFITDPSDQVLVPGDLAHSMMYNRASRVGQFQMPPLAKNVVDTNAIQVLADWINSLPPGPGVEVVLGDGPGDSVVTGPFNVDVEFTRPISGLVSNMFQVVNGQILAFSGSGTNYTLRINPQAEGTVTVQLPGGQVLDGTGHTNYPSNLLVVDYHNLDSYLLTWLRFDDGAGTTASDVSGNANNGTLFNMNSTAWGPGLYNGALTFDGVNNFVEISNALRSDFTIACWIKSTQAFPVAQNTYEGTGIIWADVGGPANDFVFGATRDANGVDRLSFFTGGGTETSINGATEISSGEWTHIAATRDGVTGEMKIYVNGELDATGMGSSGSDLNANPTIHIGGNTLDGRYFAGTIDDVRLYSRVLSESEIQGVIAIDVPPSISPIASIAITRNTSTGPIGFTVGDAETPNDELSVSAASSNTVLVPNQNIVLGGSGANRTITVTPASGQIGAATITVSVSDGTSVAQQTFTVTVNGTFAAYYPLDGNAQDASGNGNNGTISGNATFVTGKVGPQALNMDGVSAYVQITNSIRTNFTIAFWSKTTTTGGTGQWFNGKGFVDGDVAGASSDFGTSLVGNKFAFGVGNPNTTITSTTSVNDGVWHHLAATRDNGSGQMNLYVDGVLQATANGPTEPRLAATVLRIGAIQSGGSGSFLSGIVDDVRLYNYVLSTNEIVALINTTPTLAAISNRTMLAGNVLRITNNATDPDLPPQTLTYSLVTAPNGVSLNSSSGLLTWRPSVSLGGTSNLFSLRVTDNGTPNLSATQSFWVIVNRPVQPSVNVPSFGAGPFKLLISGDSGPDYTILGSTNLMDWTTILSTNSPLTPFLFTEPNATNYNQRFYRVILGP